MDTGQTLLFLLTIVVMIVTLVVSIIPFISGPLMVGALALVYALLTGLVPLPLLIIITLLMVIGTTTEYWLPLLGVRVKGISCLGAVGSILGGILGTLFIPLPILGTIIGMIAGTMLVEHARIRQWRRTIRAGQAALRLYIWGMAVEFGFSFMILLAFISTWFVV
jgi:uncharacterized protein